MVANCQSPGPGIVAELAVGRGLVVWWVVPMTVVEPLAVGADGHPEGAVDPRGGAGNALVAEAGLARADHGADGADGGGA